MTKRKKRRTTAYKKRSSTILRTVKRFIVGLSATIAFLSGLLFLFNCYFPTGNRQTAESTVGTIAEGVEIPTLKNDRRGQIIDHEGFIISYNADYRIANWAAYELTAEEVKSRHVKRTNKFIPDPKVKGATAVDSDYRRSGYDRGHLVPAGDMRWSQEGMDASFYFSNICPQNRGLNAGLWNDIEKQCRKWATKYGAIFIVTGPVIDGNMQRLGKNKVGIPNMFYKVVCSHTGGEYRSIGFLVENRNYADRSLEDVAVPVDSIESVTGIDFFPSFPEEIQSKMESSINRKHWALSKLN
ncbi:MAG: DNA/RNA non-specific endonuclease [Tannerellaceae bacterium]|jgi:endonuclease G|nr:DNA/RNA non-specific endonuclease [Tannerellaceae bacterium]